MTELNIAIAGLMAICFLFGVVLGVVLSLFIRIAIKQGESNSKPHYIPTPQFSYPPKPKHNPHK
ncbi:hypothetical protein [Psychrobacter sanguinis]|uniref:hypothetical protein n=1 Tax=Psychrobacter sanguinis TaxID=861445 RepID=UPI00191ACE2D|nr:hypothetical protein [Psychrobacter sanguinis]MCC3344868.1 hypothetical protein [Psychrobacter sanguinis]